MKTSDLRIVLLILVQCLYVDPVAHATSADHQIEFRQQALSLREAFWRKAPQEPTARVRDLFEPLGRYAVSGQRDLFGWGPAYHLGDRNRAIEAKVIAVLAKASRHSQVYVREVLLKASGGDNMLYGTFISELRGQLAKAEIQNSADIRNLAESLSQTYPMLR